MLAGTMVAGTIIYLRYICLCFGLWTMVMLNEADYSICT